MIFNYPIALTSLFFLCFVFSILINYILLRFAQTLGIRGKEQQQVRWNNNAKPALGGISFYVIFLFSFIFTLLLPHSKLGFNLQIVGILIGATLAFLMGLSDDAFNTQPLLKFLTQVLCAFVIIFSGHSISIFQNQFVNYLVTIFWVVGIMNSINMLDNMDGITTIISIVIGLFIVSVNVSRLMTDNYATTLNLGVLGALCGFLVYNFHPSKMFMGDTGSQFLGFFFAIMGIDNCWNISNPLLILGMPLLNILLVALVFLIPITDTFAVVVNRVKIGRSPFIGGKDHTTHHLFFKGITEKRIAVLFLIISSIGATLAYLLLFQFSYTLFYGSVFYVFIVVIVLYLNTIIKKK